MPTMITLSLLLNIAVLVPVTGSIMANAGWVAGAYGPPSPARGILLAVYLAILAGSAALLWKPVPAMVAALLLVQIAYKLMTPFTVGTLANPVVLSNLAIAACHALTLVTIWREIRP
ncbi:hypothetical protein [Erythrobacter sp. CCH5-A1]|jgi:hypothetical protein|uniref:hypothetical protein n=1 Tax=Erythrobacter sp. CCH5-A1 TaxID=1768792 RepID=UPI00082A63CE|nr:hypothetical protein [Erythrobacter sp. CCH5-A1]